MTGYATRHVAEILGLTEGRVRSFARAGLLEPGQGPGNTYRFTFQDIVLLRAARELIDQDVPPRRVRSALLSLRAQLPRGQPLSGVRVTAMGERVMVRDQDTAWDPETGQVALDFSVQELAEQVEPFAPDAGRALPGDEELSADDWYDLAIDLEAVLRGQIALRLPKGHFAGPGPRGSPPEPGSSASREGRYSGRRIALQAGLRSTARQRARRL